MLLCRLSLIGVTILSSSVWAQEKRPMNIVDVMNVPALSDPQLSPNGNQVLYVLAHTDWKANRRIGHIWRTNTDGTGSLQMTNGEKGESSPRWSLDGQRIAFIAPRRPSLPRPAAADEFRAVSSYPRFRPTS